MLKRKFNKETYIKIGSPDLVSLLSFNGFKGAKNELVLLGLEPYESNKNYLRKNL